jgi:nitrite reductase/ring-hydroxylating ferredoxin subunit
MTSENNVENSIVRVAIPDLAVGRAQPLAVAGKDLLVCRSSGGFHVVARICPHQFKTLDEARVRGASLICLHHGARFDLASGKSLSSMTPFPLKIYPCREGGGELEIDLS